MARKNNSFKSKSSSNAKLSESFKTPNNIKMTATSPRNFPEGTNNTKGSSINFKKKKGKFGSKQKVTLYKKEETKTKREENEAQVLESLFDQIDVKTIKTFNDMPLSGATQKALKEAGYIEPTQVQK